jgi:hypothetical protein
VSGAVRSAYEQAVMGRGASVIDLVIGGPDDAMRAGRELLTRVTGFSSEEEQAVEDKTEAALDVAIAAAREAGPPAPHTIFEHVYKTSIPALRAQAEDLSSLRKGGS